jgi:hypothetical protein
MDRALGAARKRGGWKAMKPKNQEVFEPPSFIAFQLPGVYYELSATSHERNSISYEL